MSVHIIFASVATALTVYGIETLQSKRNTVFPMYRVATALTVYGIETILTFVAKDIVIRLQQLLPFTVLKH